MYKVIYNDKVIDVIESPRFVRFLARGHIALTDKLSAHGVIGSDGETIYSLRPTLNKNYLIVTLTEIASEEELKRLQSLLSSGQEVSADESALAKAKQDKLKTLSEQCKSKIMSGFSLKLSDGELYGFKFTLEDQINLLSIENQLNSGLEYAIYHATNQPCRLFLRDDMLRIINTFKHFKIYHTTYFNTAKQYINSLTDIDKVNLFSYGEDVSDIITDKTLKQILRNGGNIN